MSRLLVLLIELYRRGFSRLGPPVCRFEPTCSVYAQQAITKYGVWNGLAKGLRRILRCHPWHNGGYDPLI